MFVIKRDGRKEPVLFDKITQRIQKLCFGLNEDYINHIEVARKVVNGIYPDVKTTELDELAAQTAAYMGSVHPDYTKLAARICISNLHKQTENSFFQTIENLYTYIHKDTQLPSPLIAKDVYEIAKEHRTLLDSEINYDHDYQYDYFGFKTLERSYLLRINGDIVERPQHLLMRVALGIHKKDITRVLETYHLLSEKWFTHASPTMFNAGTPRPQLSSCYLVAMKEDSIIGIYDTLKECAQISKYAGGIGLHVHNIRAKGSYIRDTNGYSNGLVPILQVYNHTARLCDQGGGKRKGSFAIYLEPWHADIFDFLDLKKNHGKEEVRARDLFYALWIPDLFMKRVQENGNWSLFCPNEAPGLADIYGDEFETLYHKYEQEDRQRETFPAQKLWFAILDSQIETGTPYILFKDACNRKSNQKNLGTIKSSNLCTEIIQYSDKDETSVCNLASIALPRFVKPDRKSFDFQKLMEITQIITRNLDRVIDVNFYPVEEARRSNMRHRPIGIGVQGLADVFMLMRLPFDSPEAQTLNRDIFETIYFGACTASTILAQELGSYETFRGSPASQGLLQFDLWDVEPSARWDWAGLKLRIQDHGMRNSLLVAPMPTASTSQILGNNECFEPYTSNMYVRRVLSGEFTVVNRHLIHDLIDLGLWNETIRNELMAYNGSVQNIDCVPDNLKSIYKTVWEIKQRVLVDMAADRGAFIDQSQSFNIHMDNINVGKLTSLHFYSFKKGLKTGSYYLRGRAAADAIKFTVDPNVVAQTTEKMIRCSLENKDECLSCGS